MILPVAAGLALWNALAAAGAVRCGLGARDTLRLEAALNLYGQDMDAGTSPLVVGPGLDRGLRARRTGSSAGVPRWSSRRRRAYGRS